MFYTQKVSISPNIIELFQKGKYEALVLSIMNSSTIVFPEEYERVDEQSHGECDYIGKTSKARYDAKLPFLPQQIALLTDGKKHGPQIHKWLEEMHNECVEFQPLKLREDPSYTVKQTRLFKIMKKAIMRDKQDENIVFFVPFPVVPTLHDPIFLDKTSNFLTKILDELKEECDFSERNIYVIHSSLEKNIIALRNLNTRDIEYLECSELAQYISFKIVNVFPNA
ncbi:MAG: hypothetical protein IJ265_07310 [Oscillospiraceae bacterium]|nr:hypothetical protein [Oscillospiraceae bacterium]